MFTSKKTRTFKPSKWIEVNEKKKKKFYEIDPSRTEGEEGKQYRPQVQVNNNESLIKSVLIDYE